MVVGLGEALWDMLPKGKQLGGAPANFAYHAAQLGCPSAVVSAVGKDALGNEILSNFKNKDLDYICPQIDFPTGTVQVTLDEAGVPAYEIKEHVAWDNIPFTTELEALAQRTHAVCFGSLAQRNVTSRHTIHQFLDAMPIGERNYKVFDINLRQHFYTKEIIETSLQKSNILKINDEELEIFRTLFEYSEKDLQQLCLQILKDYELKILILTCGAEGSHVFTLKEHSYLPTPEVQVADTVGAGDSFTAAFVAGLLQGKSLSECHQLAVDVSAYVCTQSGAMPVLPQEIKG